MSIPARSVVPGRLLVCMILVIAVGVMGASNAVQGQIHALGDDPNPDSASMPIKGHGNAPNTNQGRTFSWYDGFDTGNLQGWNVFCSGGNGASICLIPEDSQPTSAWCLQGMSPSHTEACGFVARSPNLEKRGLDYTAPYRISFRYKLPVMQANWTYTLIEPNVVLVVDRAYPAANEAIFGYSPSGEVGDFRWLGNLDLDRWYTVEVRVTPQETQSVFTVLLDGAPLGHGVSAVRQNHDHRLVLQDARHTRSGEFTYGGGVWDSFLVVGKYRAPTASTRQPEGIHIQQAGANPTNPAAVLSLELAQARHVRLEIFDAMGRRITSLCNQPLTAGTHRYTWRGTDAAGQSVASGVYHARMVAGDVVKTVRLTLAR